VRGPSAVLATTGLLSDTHDEAGHVIVADVSRRASRRCPSRTRTAWTPWSSRGIRMRRSASPRQSPERTGQGETMW